MTIHKCPICPQRLFDAGRGIIGKMQIKCPRCKNLVDFMFSSDGRKRVTIIPKPSELGKAK